MFHDESHTLLNRVFCHNTQQGLQAIHYLDKPMTNVITKFYDQFQWEDSIQQFTGCYKFNDYADVPTALVLTCSRLCKTWKWHQRDDKYYKSEISRAPSRWFQARMSSVSGNEKFLIFNSKST